MKWSFYAFVLCLSFTVICAAQQNSADTAASKEDIQKLFDVMLSREMISKMVDAMSKPMHDMVHQEYLRDKDKLPADFEARMNKMMDEMYKNMPWDEMLDSTVPVYQKHFTKGDINALVTFYGTPTGQKVVREMPAITAEAMQNMMPLLQKQMATINRRLQAEITTMLKNAETKSGQQGSEKNN